MKKIIVAILISACSVGHTAAQKLKVLSATRQSWSGGVAGHHGVNFGFEIETKEKVVFDSLYINHSGYKLTARHDSIKHTFTLRTGESYTDPGFERGAVKQVNNNKPLPPRVYSGAALITYHYNGKTELLDIKEVKSLPALNYP
jgi:hypothetical protein